MLTEAYALAMFEIHLQLRFTLLNSDYNGGTQDYHHLDVGV